MKVTQIQVGNYRNLVTQCVLPESKLNIFVGDNAQGKTNLVESIYLCCVGKSPRTDKDKDLVTWGESNAYVNVKYTCRYGEGEIAVNLATQGKKKIAVNSVPITKMGELMGYLNCVYFSPDEIKIISQSPAERRRFMDIDLCQTDKNYFYSLQRFNKAINQRNNLLKQASTVDKISDTLFAWNKQIADEGARIVAKRKNFCNKLAPIAKAIHEKLTDGKETLDMKYVTQVTGNSLAELTDCYAKLLDDNTEKDFNMRYTTSGCQRDDVSLVVNGIDVRNFGSQGQLRTTALSLKLAELCLFKQIIGEYPVLLLDDVLSELDVDRQKRLLGFDDDLQIILTTATQLPKELTDGLDYNLYNITKGVCTKIK